MTRAALDARSKLACSRATCVSVHPCVEGAESSVGARRTTTEVIAIRFEMSSLFFMNTSSSDQSAFHLFHSVRFPTAIMQRVLKTFFNASWHHSGAENSSRQCGGSSGIRPLCGGYREHDDDVRPPFPGRVKRLSSMGSVEYGPTRVGEGNGMGWGGREAWEGIGMPRIIAIAAFEGRHPSRSSLVTLYCCENLHHLHASSRR